jgi:anti-sigma factor RsiW
MSDRQITFEMLSTYVDGELDAAAAAEVALAVAQDPALAREVAALSRLRSAVADSVDAPPLSVPAPQTVGRRVMVVAASIALVLFVAGSAQLPGLDLASEWQARAWRMHGGWSIRDATERTRPTLRLAQYAEAVPGAQIPDLLAARLTLVHAAVAPYPGNRRALLVGYQGTRGCKISLIVFPPPDGLGAALSPLRDGKREAYAWRAGPLGYVIMSEGMDSARFRLLAESVRHTSRRLLPFDKRTRVALRKSRDESAPCFA